MLKHLFLRTPDKIYDPAIENVRKKPARIVNVSPKSGNAEIRATINTLRPLILEIVLRGLNTLNALKLAIEKPASSSSTPCAGG
jgi:hypothetical protein